MTYDDARKMAIKLKRGGATYKEIVEELHRRGAIYERTKRPYKKPIVTMWCLEASGDGPLIGDQRGYRHPHLKGLTKEERKAHDEEMHRRKLERARQWRADNPEKVREYAEQYKSLY